MCAAESQTGPGRSRKPLVLYAVAVVLFLTTSLVSSDFAIDDHPYFFIPSFLGACVSLFLAARAQKSDRFATVMASLSALALPFWLVMGAHYWDFVETDIRDTPIAFFLLTLVGALLYGIPYVLYRALTFLFRGPAHRGWWACPVLLFHSITFLVSLVTLLTLE